MDAIPDSNDARPLQQPTPAVDPNREQPSRAPNSPVRDEQTPGVLISGRGEFDSAGQRGMDPADAARIQLAWAKLVWLLSFLAVLLAVCYLVPFVAEQTQYAITRGQQRAEYEAATEHLPNSPLVQLSRSYQMISQKVAPSVVHINTTGPGDMPVSMGMPGGGMLPRRSPLDGQGSGFIVDPDGYIITNYHVVRDAREIRVALSDGRRVVGHVVGVDPETDLAVLKVNVPKVIAAQWGDSDEAQVGGLVWAVGSPFGLERSITSGILSAKHRAGLAGTPYQDFLQTDAAVNPGNSGGPLVDATGAVVGVNTAIVGDAYQGISFAVPSNVAREVYQRLKAEGEVSRGWLGVALDTVTEERAKQLGVTEGIGAYVVQVVNDNDESSPAAVAGIEVGDIVLRWNDTAVNNPADLSRIVARTDIGSTAKVVVLREGKEVMLDVRVGKRPRQ